MAKTAELRDMSDEQIHLTWKEASENLFRLRIQAQTEKLDAPTELKRHRRLIARCQTVLNERARGTKQESAAKKKSSDKTAAAKS
jgi:large subunit ribosomal protein L29